MSSAQARSGVYIIHVNYYHPEDIEDAREGAAGVEGIPHYLVYNAETRVLFTYPEVRPTYPFPHCYLYLYLCFNYLNLGARARLRGVQGPCQGLHGVVGSPYLCSLLNRQGSNLRAPGNDQVHARCHAHTLQHSAAISIGQHP